MSETTALGLSARTGGVMVAFTVVFTAVMAQPVPLPVRLILIGPPELYDSLRVQDLDFSSLFRIKVEVDPTEHDLFDVTLPLDG